jgi:hypothetical protein
MARTTVPPGYRLTARGRGAHVECVVARHRGGTQTWDKGAGRLLAESYPGEVILPPFVVVVQELDASIPDWEQTVAEETIDKLRWLVAREIIGPRLDCPDPRRREVIRYWGGQMAHLIEDAERSHGAGEELPANGSGVAPSGLRVLTGRGPDPEPPGGQAA